MAKQKLLKLTSVIFIISLLPACTLNQAMRGYDNGDYIGSIKVITNKLDQKQEFPRNSLKQNWLNTIHLSLNQLENLPTYTYDQKIQRLQKIYEARLLVGSGFYANEFDSFNQRYALKQIYLDLAKTYYEKGNSIQLLTTDSYREKAEAYEGGLKYGNYLDTGVLAAKYRKEYSTRLAEDYYQTAQKMVLSKNYKAASEFFSKALSVYANYGDYKDSRQQFTKYNKLWRTEEAERLFQLAASKERSAMRKFDYREVARLYGDAAEVYRPYGSYRNAEGLASAARKKSIITVSYTIRQDRGEDSCGTSYSRQLSQRFKSKIEDKFRAHPYQLTNSYSSNVHINVDYSAYFKEGRLEERNQVQSVVNDQGVTTRFNQRTESRKNQYELNAEIRARGDLSVSRNIREQAESEQIKTFYTGSVPSGYKNKTEGSLKDRNALCSDVIVKIEREIDYALDDIARQALRL